MCRDAVKPSWYGHRGANLYLTACMQDKPTGDGPCNKLTASATLPAARSLSVVVRFQCINTCDRALKYEPTIPKQRWPRELHQYDCEALFLSHKLEPFHERRQALWLRRVQCRILVFNFSPGTFILSEICFFCVFSWRLRPNKYQNKKLTWYSASIY